ncbi:MAG TPA: type II secretion system protein GspL [Novosphingobium sp.]|nr:type II secretion system protein GspL [Novosphingobium sp.]
MTEAILSDGTLNDGLIVLLPAAPGAPWQWWRVDDGELGAELGYDPDDDRPWGDLDETARVVALAPAAEAPVRMLPRGQMPLAQALAAARIETAEAPGEGWGATATHVVAASSDDGRSILVAAAATAAMDAWLARLAAAGLVPEAIVPAALILPPPENAAVTAELGGQPLARTAAAAFAGEPELVAALAGEDVTALDSDALDNALLAAWRAPPLNLRQGVYAPRRGSVFRVPAGVPLARMAAIALLLGFLILAVETIKLNADASAREAEALAAAQRRFPAAVDLATAQTLAAGELARRGQGGGTFAAPAAAVLAAIRPIPSLRLRDLGYAGDGTLRFTAAAPTADDINHLLLDLQNEGWQVTVPPQLAPDATGATVAAITVRAP